MNTGVALSSRCRGRVGTGVGWSPEGIQLCAFRGSPKTRAPALELLGEALEYGALDGPCLDANGRWSLSEEAVLKREVWSQGVWP